MYEYIVTDMFGGTLNYFNDYDKAVAYAVDNAKRFHLKCHVYKRYADCDGIQVVRSK